MLPIINMKRTDLESCADLQWLLNSCHIDLSSLICIDEIDLPYYDPFGSLNLVLLNCDMIRSKQEVLKGAIVEVFNCSKSNPSYSHVDSITMGQDTSCCTVIAERYMQTSPEILSGRGFSRLLVPCAHQSTTCVHIQMNWQVYLWIQETYLDHNVLPKINTWLLC